MRTLDPESKSATSFQENDQNTEKPAIAKQQVEVIRTISQHNPNDPYMDLAKKSLTIIPQELFVLSQLQVWSIINCMLAVSFAKRCFLFCHAFSTFY